MADAKMITVNIDGTPVQVPDGTYVWDACRKVGLEIPNFCYIPGLRAFGACRMCVVEVSGRKGFELVTSCSTPATDGMEVRTINERVWQQRNMVMEALDTDHPIDCPICEANGDCRLQDYGYEYGVTGTDMRRPKIVRPAERLSPAIDLDRDRCVFCGRCVRECDETIGATALAFVERGVESLIDAPFGRSLLETPCVSCGMCVELCPVGALSSRLYNPRNTLEHHWWQRKTETTCNYCSVGCTLKLGVTRNHLWEVRTDDGLGLNDGRSCVKGRFGMDVVSSNNRLSTPLVRRDGQLVQATWSEALDLVASRLHANSASMAVVGSPKLTNEEAYALQKLARLGFGTNNVDYDGRATEAAPLEVLREMLGYAAPTNNLIDTRQKSGCILTIGDSIYETHPVYGYQLQRMARLTNKTLIVISPRYNKMCEWATIWLAPPAGMEDLVVHAMARVILDAGLAMGDWLLEQAEGSGEYMHSLRAKELSLEEVALATGIPQDDIVAAAYLFATGGKESGPVALAKPTHPSNLFADNGHSAGGRKDTSGDIPSAKEPTAQATPTRPEGGYPPSTIVFSACGPYTLTPRTVAGLVNLSLLTGNIGRAGGGVNPLVKSNNSMGAIDMGLQPGYFPGMRPVTADNAREMEELWSANPDAASPEVSAEPGMSLAQMVEAAETGDLKAMWVVGSNPVLSPDMPDSERVRAALGKLDFLVVQDIYMNETGEIADVILPASSYAEKEGTFTNAERRVQRVRQALEPVGVTKPDLYIFNEVAKRLGLHLLSYNPKEVMDEIARVVPVYAGVSYARLEMMEFVDDAIPMPAAVSYKQLKIRGLMWPVSDRMDPGTPVLYTEGFGTPTGKARMWSAKALQPETARGVAQFGGDTLLATVGFGLFPFGSGTLSRHSSGMSEVEPHPRLHLHPEDAERIGVGDAAPVVVSLENESGDDVYAISLVSDRTPKGRAFLAMRMVQAGTSPTVRQIRYTIASDRSGERKAVTIRVRQAAGTEGRSMREVQPPATDNVLNPALQP
jgi:predicted molibdopterin-dependent oxidoreductase YjgC